MGVQYRKMTGIEFVGMAIENNVLAIQGSVFSDRTTHFRISYAVDEDSLEQGLSIIRNLMT